MIAPATTEEARLVIGKSYMAKKDDSKRPFVDKATEAFEAFLDRYQYIPEFVLINDRDAASYEPLDTVTVLPLSTVPRHEIWIGPIIHSAR